jgi:hypothetical protein
VRSEGNVSIKNPVATPGIDPGTVRLVAQRLNHYATPGVFNKYLIRIQLQIKKHQLRDRIIRTRRYGQCFKETVILRSGIVIHRYRGTHKNHDEPESEC